MRQSQEDYLEAVLAIEQEDGVVRLTDVALRLKVTKPSASRAMKLLQADGYINQESYGTIELTSKGRITASQIYTRHKTLRTFLKEVLKVGPETAESDACKMEHVLSSETMEKLTEFVDLHTTKEG